MKLDGFFRHIHACRTAKLPGNRREVRFQGARVGYIKPETLAVLGLPDQDLNVPDQLTFDRYARSLCTGGAHRFRDEAFDVWNEQGQVVATLDRGALPLLGIQAMGVHMNGLVHARGGWNLWIGTRNPNKLLDPGKLDHLVAGGVPAGMGPDEALIKEAAEEAGIPADLASRASRVSEIRYDMERPEGLRRDVLECYDLIVPDDFIPHPCDGEVIGFELWPVDQVMETVRDTDRFKFNVNLVLIDLFLRQGLIESDELRHELAAS
jgi:8-oxo-dGTP pyrophosphatase MutT (NUDIX family)